MKHTRKRRAFAQRPGPIGITPFRKGVADRRIQQRLRPFYTARRLLSISAALQGRLFVYSASTLSRYSMPVAWKGMVTLPALAAAQSITVCSS